MEDAHIAEPNLTDKMSLFAVFDGHGGPEVAKFCKEHFISNFLINENFKKGNYVEALKENFLKMDEILLSDKGTEMLQRFRTESEIVNSQAGCTANVVLITEDKIYVANAGDARTILFTKGE